jgi:hypothetical protein
VERESEWGGRSAGGVALTGRGELQGGVARRRGGVRRRCTAAVRGGREGGRALEDKERRAEMAISRLTVFSDGQTRAISALGAQSRPTKKKDGASACACARAPARLCVRVRPT